MHKPPSKAKPLTAKRKQILEKAMAQLKKTRAQMDPTVLGKIRSIIANNPKVMKGLGLDKMPVEEGGNRVSPISQKDAPNKPQEQKGTQEKATEEIIDPAHNQEVIAKLMQLKPSEVENIKKVLMRDKG